MLATHKSMNGIQEHLLGANAEAPSTERTMETSSVKLSPSQAMAPSSPSALASMTRTEFHSAKDMDTFEFMNGMVQAGINSAAISKEKGGLTYSGLRSRFQMTGRLLSSEQVVHGRHQTPPKVNFLMLFLIRLATHASTNGTVRAGTSSGPILMEPLMVTKQEKQLPYLVTVKQSLLDLLKATAMELTRGIPAFTAGMVRLGVP